MKSKRMQILSWGSLVFNFFVIVWGAFVRASGSGAGCGSHWPLCNGEIIPRAASAQTAIEYTHRLTSGMCLILACWIAYEGIKRFPKGDRVRRGAIAVLVLTLTEALIGAGLVLLGHVAYDQSMGRVISISLHLTNTFLLLAALALTAWWSTFGTTSARANFSGEVSAASIAPRRLRGIGISALAWTVALGMTGAITALGDTLFQSASLSEGIRQDFSAASHFLLKLRVIHPILAVIVGGWIFFFAEQASKALSAPYERLVTSTLKGLVIVQLGVGLLNLGLMAPIWLQLIHLFVADCLWVALVLTTAAVYDLERA